MTRTPTPRTGSTPARRAPDVVGLVFGALFIVLSAGSLFVAFGGQIHSSWLKAGVPLVLIAVGVAGLLLSRGRTP